jgi:phosphoglycerate dehydrogenase-like enzyme
MEVMTKFRVALSADFLKSDGRPVFPDFDLTPLRSHRDIEIGYVAAEQDVIPASSLEDYDALILLAFQMRRQSLPRSRRLGIVARFGVGYDSVDVEALADEGVATVITPGGVGRPVAVGILTFILALAGKILAKDRLTRMGAKGFAEGAATTGMGLVGKTLGTVGLGNIGTEMVRIMRPLGLKFIGYDPHVSEASARKLGVRLVSLETLLRDSDFVTINCPLTPTTRGLINGELLALMKPSAYLINTARGPIVDQQALTQLLKTGRIAGAGLDVFDPEPPKANDDLLGLECVILAPHSVAMTNELISICGALDINAILDVMHGREPKGVVQPRVRSHAEWRRRLEANRARFGD